MVKPFISMKNVSKVFPGVKALDDVSIDFYSSEVHAIMGENGAGKSTLIKILSGVYQRDAGDVYLNGEEVHFQNTHEALAAGISIIHQELSVIPDLTVAENIYLGREPLIGKTGLVDKRKMTHDAQKLIDSLGLTIKANVPIRKISNADKQMVEIIRAISQNSSMVIMDEPTSSLSERETEILFGVINKLRADNVAIIYITSLEGNCLFK